MMVADNTEDLKQKLARAEAALREIRLETAPRCAGCPCSGSERRVRTAYRWAMAVLEPEALSDGHQWLAERLREGSELWDAHEQYMAAAARAVAVEQEGGS